MSISIEISESMFLTASSRAGPKSYYVVVVVLVVGLGVQTK